MKFTVQKPFLAQMIEKIRHLDFDFGLNGTKILRLRELSFSLKIEAKKNFFFNFRGFGSEEILIDVRFLYYSM